MTKSAADRAEVRFKQLCCLGLGGEEIVPALLNELQMIVPSLGSTFFFLDAKSELSNVYDENPAAPSVALLYLEQFYKRPDREMGAGFCRIHHRHRRRTQPCDAAIEAVGVHDGGARQIRAGGARRRRAGTRYLCRNTPVRALTGGAFPCTDHRVVAGRNSSARAAENRRQRVGGGAE